MRPVGEEKKVEGTSTEKELQEEDYQRLTIYVVALCLPLGGSLVFDSAWQWFLRHQILHSRQRGVKPSAKGSLAVLEQLLSTLV